MAEGSDDWKLGTGDAYAHTIRAILKEALEWEGFWLETSDGRIDYLDLNWVTSAGRQEHRTLYEKDDRG